MRAQILPFKAKTQPETCRCPRHELDALLARFDDALARTDGELLIARECLLEARADLSATTDRLLPPDDERGTR